MPKKLEAIKDPGIPGFTDGKTQSLKSITKMDKTMSLREIIPEGFGTSSGRPDSPVEQVKTLKRIKEKIDSENVSKCIMDAIEMVQAQKVYCIGKGANRLFCGPVIQVVPNGGYAKIYSNRSVLYRKPPNLNKEFLFDSDKQIALKVGPNILEDYALVVGANGCVLLTASSVVSLNMPVFIVEAKYSRYYYANHGQRSMNLQAGAHLILFTKEVPIIYIKVNKRRNLNEKSSVDSLKSQISMETESLKSKSKSTDSKKSKSEEKKKSKDLKPRSAEQKSEPKKDKLRQKETQKPLTTQKETEVKDHNVVRKETKEFIMSGEKSPKIQTHKPESQKSKTDSTGSKSSSVKSRSEPTKRSVDDIPIPIPKSESKKSIESVSPEYILSESDKRKSIASEPLLSEPVPVPPVSAPQKQFVDETPKLILEPVKQSSLTEQLPEPKREPILKEPIEEELSKEATHPSAEAAEVVLVPPLEPPLEPQLVHITQECNTKWKTITCSIGFAFLFLMSLFLFFRVYKKVNKPKKIWTQRRCCRLCHKPIVRKN